jgi:protoporphyrinogen/coproporphyrinogen III oxidase
LRDGMSSFVEALAERLPAGTVQLASPVNHILPHERDRWLLLVGGDHRHWLEVDALITATPAYKASKLLAGLDSTLAYELAEIEYSSCAVVSLGYLRVQIERPLDGFGFVVPTVERRNILSCSYSSVKYAGRAPDDSVLLRVVLGGTAHRGLLSLTDDELVELARSEVSELLHIEGEPVLTHLSRRRHAMPQYHVGHRQRIEKINQRLARFPTLALAGNAYCGVGIPACIQSGQAAAERCLRQLKLHAPTSSVTAAAAEASV